MGMDEVSRINQYLKIIRNINQLIVREKNKQRLLTQSCRFLKEDDNVHFAAIIESDILASSYPFCSASDNLL